MIPKKIHYCWLGRNKKPELVEKCMDSWSKYALDYEVLEWNEDNFPFADIKCKYVKEAIKAQKWAFVTDYMRLYVLKNMGGVYLDTDVELCRSLDEFLNENSFIGFESRYTVCTAVIGAEKDSEWLSYLLDQYNDREFCRIDGRYDQTPNTKFIINVLQEIYGLKGNNGDHQVLPCGLHVYPSEYFSPKNYATMQMKITENTYAIHHYNATWKSASSKIKDQVVAAGARLLGETTIEKLKRKIKR